MKICLSPLNATSPITTCLALPCRHVIPQTSVVCKLMERIIAADMLDFLTANGHINPHQHGFLRKRSTETNLLEALSDWTLTLNSKASRTIAYIDFCKAFDSVCRNKLLIKLDAYGIKGNLLQLINDFLCNRSQKTRVGSSLSGSVSLSSGVVQGSCLGPLLFIIYINDLPEMFDTAVVTKMYADDVKLYTNVHCAAGGHQLQANLTKLFNWSTIWQLPISVKKCAVMAIGKNTSQLTTPSLTLGHSSIPAVESISDLGVTVHRSLTFASHICNVVRKASVRMNLMFKCFTTRHNHTLIRGYKVYVRPILEHCSIIWSPYRVKDIKAIETVQRKFTKRLNGLQYKSYADRLLATNLESLQERRIKSDLIFAYKILFGYVDIDSRELLVPCLNSHNTRGHAFKLTVPPARVDARKFFLATE